MGPADPTALGLSCVQRAGLAALGLWVGQLASAPGAHPPEVSGVGALPGFQVWAPSLLIWVHVSRASGECPGCLFLIHCPGAEGGGSLEAVAAAESFLISC